MALGDTYNNNEKKNYSPSVVSGYKFTHPESEVDKTSLSFTYWNKLLKVSIAPKKETAGDTIAFDHENAGCVYLSHTKAFMFYNEIVKFIKDYNNGVAPNNVGVHSGTEGLIYVSNGKEFNAEGPCLVIRKVDNGGRPTSTFVYEFRTKMHASIIDYNVNGGFKDNAYPLLELEQFANLLKSYYEAMTMAVAYSVKEVNKYDDSRTATKLKLIGDKLGVEFTKSNFQSKSTNNSYFSNARAANENSSYSGNTTYETGSLDDLD